MIVEKELQKIEDEVKKLILFEDLLNISRDFENQEKFNIFETLNIEFENKQLLNSFKDDFK